MEQEVFGIETAQAISIILQKASESICNKEITRKWEKEVV